MKALIYRDIILLTKGYWLIFLLGIFYIFFPELQFLSMLLMAVISHMVIQLDDKSGWRDYEYLLPISLKQMVLRRYVLCYIAIVIITVLMIIYQQITLSSVDYTTIILSVLSALIFNCIIMPIYFKLTPTQIRIVNFVLVFAAYGALYAITNYGFFASGITTILSSPIFVPIIIALTVLANLVSIAICMKFSRYKFKK